MSVTFKKTALIAATREALATADAAEREYQRRVESYRAEYASQRDVTAGIRALRDELSAFLKTRRQPTAEDAQRFHKAAGVDGLTALYTPEPNDYQIKQNVPAVAGRMAKDTQATYQGLIKMLQAHTEDTITANQLKLFGYDRLEPLFRLAAMHSPVTDA